MIVETDFLTHWKTRMLALELKDASAPMYVLSIWAHCQTRRSDVLPSNPNAIKAICSFAGDGEVLLKALIDAGFIDKRGDKLISHDWAKTNAKLLANWQNGKRGGRPNKTQHEPNRNPPKPTLSTLSNQNPSLEGLSAQDRHDICARIVKLFNRTKPLTRDELEIFMAAGIEKNEIGIIEAWYDKASRESDYRVPESVPGLLKNWRGSVDRAVNFKPRINGRETAQQVRERKKAACFQESINPRIIEP